MIDRPIPRSVGATPPSGWFLLLPCLVAVFGASPSHADVFASTGQAVPVVANPQSVQLADLDSDGHLDLVAAALFNGASVRFGDGTGGFLETGQELPLPTGAFEVAVGDVDGDGDPDLAIVTDDGVSIRLNDGTGTFGLTGPEVMVGSSPRGLSLGDLDQDGNLDLVTANRNDATCSVRLGDGSGTFPAVGQEVPVGPSPESMTLADVDQDGDLDIVAASNPISGPWAVNVRSNDGSGNFSTAGPDLPVTGGPGSVRAADLDLDGDIDIVTANANATCTVWLGDGAGTFTSTAQEVPIESTSLSLALEDVDDDGIPDIVAANLWSYSCSVRLGLGDGTFDPEGQDVPIGPEDGPDSIDFTTGVALGDVNQDGLLDLAATFIYGFGTDVVAVRLNLAVVFRRGDANSDSSLDLSDPLSVLDYLFYGGEPLPCDDAGDMNDDGVLGLGDPVFGLLYLFSSGAPPPEPFSSCALDPTPDGVGCEEFSACP